MPDMPPVDGPDYLIAYLFDVGPVVNTGMGAVELRSEHLIAWQRDMGIALQPWESRFLRRLSQEYLAQSHKSTKPECPAPYGLETRREIVAAKIDAIFG